jgi:ABC-type multidrug transport system fused ATPase/permease subunit
MEEKIRAYVEDLFAGTSSRKAIELKEEMIQNLTEKYHDLLSEGKSPDAAFNIAIAGIGDVSGLIRDLQNEALDPKVIDAYRQKTAMITAIAIMLYILSVVPLIVLSVLVPGAWLIGLVVMFLLIATATGMLIYSHMSKPRYVKADDTMVEEFRQWQSDTREKRTMQSAISGAMWSLLVAVYFIVSFMTGAWYITWVIFIIGGAIQSIIRAVVAAKK